MKKILLSLCLSVCAGGALAQSKIVTVVAKGYTNGVPRVASVVIPTNQAARVVQVMGSSQGGAFGGRNQAISTVEKSGVVFPDAYDITIEGPAVFYVTFSPTAGQPETDAGLLTLERWQTRRVIPIR